MKFLILIGTILSMLLSGCSIKNQANTSKNVESELQVNQLATAFDDYDISDFYGEWEAIEYITEDEFTQNDFFPGKYIGHKITISEHGYYMEFWGVESDDYEPSYIDHYSISEVDIADYEYLNKVRFDFAKDATILALYQHPKEQENDYDSMDFIVDKNHLICPTSSGWYLYEKIDKNNKTD